MNTSKFIDALISGFAGAVALNVLHETARHLLPRSPRVDVIGERAVVRSAKLLGMTPPRGRALYGLAVAGDLLANTLHYAAVAPVTSASTTYGRGVGVGLWGGLTALIMPRLLGLGNQPHQSTPITHILTLLWYVVGGVTAAALYRRLQRGR